MLPRGKQTLNWVGRGSWVFTVLLGLGQVACLARVVCDFLRDGNQEVSPDRFEVFMEGVFQLRGNLYGSLLCVRAQKLVAKRHDLLVAKHRNPDHQISAAIARRRSGVCCRRKHEGSSFAQGIFSAHQGSHS